MSLNSPIDEQKGIVKSREWKPMMKLKFTATETKKRMKGKWPELLFDAGLAKGDLCGTYGRPCPKCGGTDRFAPLADFADRGVVHCRICFTSGCEPKPGDGIATLRWLRGLTFVQALEWIAEWYHEFGRNNRNANFAGNSLHCFTSEDRSSPKPVSPLSEVVRGYNSALYTPFICGKPLGLSLEVFHRLQVGFTLKDEFNPDNEEFVTTWPMFNAQGLPIGLLFRSNDGRKWSWPNSQDGLFMDRSLLALRSLDRVLVCEGATDTAAMMDLKYNAIGLPFKGGAMPILRDVLKTIKPKEVVVVADRDADGGGLEVAKRVQDQLESSVSTRILLLPVGLKDARDWVLQGADRSTIDNAIELTEVRSNTNAKGEN